MGYGFERKGGDMSAKNWIIFKGFLKNIWYLLILIIGILIITYRSYGMMDLEVAVVFATIAVGAYFLCFAITYREIKSSCIAVHVDPIDLKKLLEIAELRYSVDVPDDYVCLCDGVIHCSPNLKNKLKDGYEDLMWTIKIMEIA